MDTTDYPSIPKLRQVHARLAYNSRKVSAVIESQLDGIEQLFKAAVAEDWLAVAKASRLLSRSVPEQVGHEVIREARKVYEELKQTRKRSCQPRHLAKLLEACRALRKRI